VILGEVRVHPLKSASAIVVDRVELDDFGPRHDRRWMAVGQDDVFLSQREVAGLALVRTGFEAGLLRLEAPGLPPLVVPPGSAPRSVRVWRDAVDARDCGDAAAEWVTAALGRPARLVHLPDDGRRPIPAPYGRPGDRVAFSDALPFLVLTRASLDDLNARLAEPLPVDRFRPNLVIDGAEPYADDRWRRIRVGRVELDVVKPCARCVVTTTDQRTGERGREPLRTLATYRRRDGHVWFAQNAIHRGRGALRVGDPVEVLEEGPAPEFERGP
jgi:uncharacterized protein